MSRSRGDLNPDWAGIVVHYPDGRLMLLQLDQPRGEIEIEAERRETTWDELGVVPPYRTWEPTGVRTGRVTLDGLLISTEWQQGGRPDWARVKREIEAARPAIEEGRSV